MSADIFTDKLEGGGRCPSCQKQLDGYTHLDGVAHPSPGDFSICFYCQVWLVFEADGKSYRIMEQKDLDGYPDSFVMKIKAVGKLLDEIRG